jgi:hypothetical protein
VLFWRAFGWRALCVALVFIGASYPSRFYWTGGAYLRQDWLAASIAGVSLLRLGRHALGGAALTWAALLRIFPGFLAVPVLLRIGYRLLKQRKLEREGARFIIGCSLATAILVPASFVTGGGTSVYLHAKQNTAKHLETPLTNHMGLRTILAYSPSKSSRFTANYSLDDPFSVWKQARRDVFHSRRVLFALVVLATLVLLARAAIAVEAWVAAALGCSLIVVGAELTCYYYSFLARLAPLVLYRAEAGAAVVGLAAAGHLLASWRNSDDERYTLMSAASLLVVLLALAIAPRWFRRPAAETEPQEEDPEQPGRRTQRAHPAAARRRKRATASR